MKTFTHKPLRTNFTIPVTFSRKDPKSRRGMTRFSSKLDEITKIKRYNPFQGGHNNNVRITNVKRLSSNKANPLYHAVGVGNIEGNFDVVKSTLREHGFTGVRMGGLVFNLS